MEQLPKDSFLEYHENTLQEVRKTLNLDKPGAMQDVVNILEEWAKEQPHFTKKSFDRRYLEMTIILCKGSLERAKSRIDKACTIRTLMPHLFEILDCRHVFGRDAKNITQSVLPKLTNNNERVYIAKVFGKTFEDTFFLNVVRAAPCIGDYVRRNDYALRYCLVFDAMEANLVDLARVCTFNLFQEYATYTLDCCGFRVKGIYLISSSTLVEFFVAMFRRILSAKLGERLYVIKDRESLKDLIDEDILPVEYGGHEKSLEELQDKWMDAVTSTEHMKYLKEIYSARTDEDKRQTLMFNEQYMGMPGSFRKLYVD